MTEKTYTKGDIMAALNDMKEPSADERRTGSNLNENNPIRYGIAGAEALAKALLDGVNAREAVIEGAGMLCVIDMFKRFVDSLDVVEEAEKATTPPRGVMRDAA